VVVNKKEKKSLSEARKSPSKPANYS